MQESDSQPVTEVEVSSVCCDEGSDHIEVDAAEEWVDWLDAVDARVADDEQSESLSLA